MPGVDAVRPRRRRLMSNFQSASLFIRTVTERITLRAGAKAERSFLRTVTERITLRATFKVQGPATAASAGSQRWRPLAPTGLGARGPSLAESANNCTS